MPGESGASSTPAAYRFKLISLEYWITRVRLSRVMTVS
jgi:hypothetical protein